jgi:hypothetical protein
MTYKTFFTALITGVVLGMLAALFTWLMQNETSPNNGLTSLWMLLNFPAFMGLMMAGGRSLSAGLFFIFLQWFVVGFVGALIVRWMLGRKKTTNEKDSERIPPSQRMR